MEDISNVVRDDSESSKGQDQEVKQEQNEGELERKTLARREDKAVKWLRVIVFLVLLASTTLVALLIYSYGKSQQKEEFERDFESFSAKILESFQTTMERKLEALDTLASSITSYVLASSMVWPNVTVPHFEVRAANARIVADVPIANFYPLVTDDTRAGWEAYAVENRDAHFDRSLAAESTLRMVQDAVFNHTKTRHLQQGKHPLPTSISRVDATGTPVPVERGTGPYLPIWHMSPFIPLKANLMHDVLAHPWNGPAYRNVIKTEMATMGPLSSLEGDDPAVVATRGYYKALLSLGQYRSDPESLLFDTTSQLGYPVFDTFDIANRKIAGFIGSTLYWKLYLKNILPPSARGIICVLENTLGQAITYRIDGSRAIFLGNEDLHDESYDSFEKRRSVAEYLSAKASLSTKSFTSVGLDFQFSDYTLNVYPSKEFEKHYYNNQPLVYTSVIIGVFIFTSLVFVIYDCLVSRRQKIVMDRAVASSSIVSSLFPSQVRDQIYIENAKKTALQAAENRFQNRGSDFDGDLKNSKPIAEVFPHTTIMFADLAGFTQWSSKRKPEEVFILLETLYQAFDRIATQRKVFKVETIGDCYVAVTGLPEPQEDHAVRMAKFTRDCMLAMADLLAKLSGQLGGDTLDLAFRAGMHSGPVTGGVLRGQKGRFQLFGDTMNTASRMESNGVKGRIHVSQDTADELTRAGKGDWIVPREDKIIAKGKGEMQTYFVSPSEKAQTMTSSSSAPKSKSAVSDLNPDMVEQVEV